jgi:hypothetical protein
MHVCLSRSSSFYTGYSCSCLSLWVTLPRNLDSPYQWTNETQELKRKHWMPAVLFNASLGWLLEGALLIVHFNNDGTDTFIFWSWSISQSLLTHATINVLTYCPLCFCLYFNFLGSCMRCLSWQMFRKERFFCFTQPLLWQACLHIFCTCHQHAFLLPFPSLMCICYDLDHMNIFGSGLAHNLLVQENRADASSGRFGNPQLMVVVSLWLFM